MTMERQRDLPDTEEHPDDHLTDGNDRLPQIDGQPPEDESASRTALGLLIGSAIGCILWAIIFALGYIAWIMIGK